MHIKTVTAPNYQCLVYQTNVVVLSIALLDRQRSKERLRMSESAQVSQHGRWKERNANLNLMKNEYVSLTFKQKTDRGVSPAKFMLSNRALR